jgi:hypothetical protein
MHLNARMQQPMRTTVELSDRTYTRLRARAAERGMRGFSAIVEEALERHLVPATEGDKPDEALAEAEGAWGERDVEEWERACEEVWATWPTGRSSTQTS